MADNLLDKASILLTPTAYNDGSMLSVKPNENLYGSELVTNGDFATDSDWTKGTGITISGGSANFTGSANANINQNIGLITGKTYKIVFTVSNYISGDIDYNVGGNTRKGAISANGTYTDYVVSDSGQFLFFQSDQSLGFVGSIDNVSVVEDLSGDFTFSRSSAATRVNAQGLVENVQIISSELVSNGNFSQIGTEEVSNGNFSQEGSELITNGDFSNGLTNWSVNGGSYATIVDGALNSNNTENGSWFAENISQSVSFVQNKIYKVTFKAKNISGNLNLRITHQSHIIFSENITSSFVDYTIYYTAQANNDSIRIFCNDAVGQFQIDNVSVKEVGQDWTLSSGASVGEDKLDIDAGAFDFFATQTALTNGLNYKVTLDAEVTSGDILLYTGTQFASINSSGSYTFYTTSDSAQIRFRSGGSGFNGSITNISVKEVGQDWTFGTEVIVGDGFVKMDDSAALQGAQQTGVVTNGSLCRVTFTVQNYINGIVNLRHPLNENVSANGTYTFTGNANDTKLLIRGNDTTNDFEVTNISVKEITDDTDLPRINYEGFSYQDSLGSELVVNGDFSNGSANWNFGGDWDLVNRTAEIKTSTVSYLIQSNAIPLTVKTYKLQYEVVTTNGSNFRLAGGSSAFGTVTLDSATVGVKTIYLTSNGTVSNLQFNQNSFRGSIDNVSVKEYLGQEVVPDSGCGSWLLEPQSTNLITESESFSSWNKDASVSITSTDKSSPLGTNNASEITVTNSGRLYHDPTISTTADRVTSIFIKGGTFVNFKFTCIVSSEIDLNAETATNNFGIQKLTNGWFRISTTAQSVTPTSRRIQLQAYPDNTYTNGHGQTGTYFVIGTQMENTLLTSYIPTNGATNTRLQDIANNSGNSTLINSTEGVLYAEIAALADDLTNRMIALSDSNSSDHVRIYYTNSTNKISVAIKSNGSNQYIFLNYNVTDITSYIKIAVKYKANDFATFINGVKVNSQTTTSSAPIGLDRLNFDSGVGGSPFYGKAKALAVFPILTDAQLQSLTTQ